MAKRYHQNLRASFIGLMVVRPTKLYGASCYLVNKNSHKSFKDEGNAVNVWTTRRNKIISKAIDKMQKIGLRIWFKHVKKEIYGFSSMVVRDVRCEMLTTNGFERRKGKVLKRGDYIKMTHLQLIVEDGLG